MRIACLDIGYFPELRNEFQQSIGKANDILPASRISQTSFEIIMKFVKIPITVKRKNMGAPALLLVICKTTNEYFQYLFERWDCLHTMFAWQSQAPQEFTYATVPARAQGIHSTNPAQP
jgi:hypothetical protein